MTTGMRDDSVLRWVDRWIERSCADRGAARPASERTADLCLELAERLDDEFTLDAQEAGLLEPDGDATSSARVLAHELVILAAARLQGAPIGVADARAFARHVAARTVAWMLGRSAHPMVERTAGSAETRRRDGALLAAWCRRLGRSAPTSPRELGGTDYFSLWSCAHVGIAIHATPQIPLDCPRFAVQTLDLQTGVIQGLLAVAHADGRFDPSEQLAMRALLDAFGMLADERSIGTVPVDPSRWLARIQRLPAPHRRFLVARGVEMALTDGQLSRPEMKLLRHLSTELEVPRNWVQARVTLARDATRMSLADLDERAGAPCAG